MLFSSLSTSFAVRILQRSWHEKTVPFVRDYGIPILYSFDTAKRAFCFVLLFRFVCGIIIFSCGQSCISRRLWWLLGVLRAFFILLFNYYTNLRFLDDFIQRYLELTKIQWYVKLLEDHKDNGNINHQSADNSKKTK